MGERKLVSFDWAMKKILQEKAIFLILEGFLRELFKITRPDKPYNFN